MRRKRRHARRSIISLRIHDMAMNVYVVNDGGALVMYARPLLPWTAMVECIDQSGKLSILDSDINIGQSFVPYAVVGTS